MTLRPASLLRFSPLLFALGCHAETPAPAAPVAETSCDDPVTPEAAAAPVAQVAQPVPSAPRVIGYFTNWAHHRKAPCAFKTSDVRAELFTHINYSFAGVKASADKESYELTPTSPEDETRLYGEVIALKQKNPKLEVLLSVGGWAFNDKPTEWIFSAMAETPARRASFIRHATEYLRRFGFDGLDIDWEFPVAEDRGGRPEDRANFTALLRELRAHFREEAQKSGRPELKLTIAAPAGFLFYQNLELDQIHEPLDWINLMTYDYHGDWDKKTGANAPLIDQGADIEESIAAYVAAGTPRGKLVLGFATYARGFGGVESATPGSPASLPGPEGPCGKDSLMVHHVADWVKTGRYQETWDVVTQTPYAYSKKEKAWITYENAKSYGIKLDFLKREKLGGAMFWAIDLDDVAHGYPLIRQVSEFVLGPVPAAATATTTKP